MWVKVLGNSQLSLVLKNEDVLGTLVCSVHNESCVSCRTQVTLLLSQQCCVSNPWRHDHDGITKKVGLRYNEESCGYSVAHGYMKSSWISYATKKTGVRIGWIWRLGWVQWTGRGVNKYNDLVNLMNQLKPWSKSSMDEKP